MENNEIKTNPNAGQGLGIASLVIGILAVIAAFIPCFGMIAILFGVLAIIFGAVGMSQAKAGNASNTMPKSGFILGICATSILIIYMLYMLFIIGAIGKTVMDSAGEITKAIDSAKVNIDTNSIKMDSVTKIIDSVK